MTGKKKEGIKLKPLYIWLIISILAFTAVLVYSPHFYYKYPFHIDEWAHINYAERLLHDQNYNVSVALSQGNFEIGYHLFLAGLFTVEKTVGIDPVLAYKFLPAAFAVLASLVLFFIMFKLTKNYWIGIFSMLFFATLKTNVNLLGLWFALPITFCIPLVFLFFFLFIIGWNEKPWVLIWAMIVFFIIMVTHAPSASFMVPILVVYMIINHEPLKAKSKKWPYFVLFLMPILAGCVIYFEAISKGSILASLKFVFSKLIFKYGFTPTEPVLLPLVKLSFLKKVILVHPYFIPHLFGFGAFVFAVIGSVFTLKDKKLYIFTIWVLITTTLLSLFINFNFIILAPYQRMVYYCLLGLVPLSAIGIVKSVQWLYHRKIKWNKLLIVVIVVGVFFLSSYNYSTPPQGFELYKTMTDNNYAALKFMNTYDNGKMIWAPLILGDTIYSLSKNNAFVSPLFIGNDDMRWDNNAFFLSENCTERKRVLEIYKPDYVISENAINCSDLGMTLIYNKGDYIYKASS